MSFDKALKKKKNFGEKLSGLAGENLPDSETVKQLVKVYFWLPRIVFSLTSLLSNIKVIECEGKKLILLLCGIQAKQKELAMPTYCSEVHHSFPVLRRVTNQVPNPCYANELHADWLVNDFVVFVLQVMPMLKGLRRGGRITSL